MTGEIDNDDVAGLIAWEENINASYVTGTKNLLYEYTGNDITDGLYDNESYNIPVSIGFTEGYTIPSNWFLKANVKLSGTGVEDVTQTNVTLGLENVVVGESSKWVTTLINLDNVTESLDPETLMSSFDTITLSNIKVFESGEDDDTEIPVTVGEIPETITMEVGA